MLIKMSESSDYVKYMERRISKQIPELIDAYGQFKIDKEYKDTSIKYIFSNDTVKFTYEAYGSYPFIPPIIIFYYKNKSHTVSMKTWSLVESLTCIYTEILNRIENYELMETIEDFNSLTITDIKTTVNNDNINILDLMNTN